MTVFFEHTWRSGVVFEFELRDLEVYLTEQIKTQEHRLSMHKQVAIEQQRIIRWFRERLEVVHEELRGQGLETIKWEDVTPANWAEEHFCFAVVKNGYGVCLSPYCQKIYSAAELHVDNSGFGRGVHCICCPEHHELLQDCYVL